MRAFFASEVSIIFAKIILWSSKNVFRKIGICWGAQALLKEIHNIEKYSINNKLFGVYDHNLNQEKQYRLMNGFIDRFPMPVSRFTENKENEILKAGLEILAFSKEDLGSAAKLVNDFKKDNKLLKPVVVAVNGELVDVAKLSQIAALPNKDQAISMLMAVMKLPIEKFVRTLSAPNVKLVQTLSAYKIKLEQS